MSALFRYCLTIAAILTITFLLTTKVVTAVEATTTPPLPKLPDSPLIVSAYHHDGVYDVVSHKLVGTTPRYIELYNNSNDLLEMRGWDVTIHGATTDFVVQLAGDFYMTPHGYTVVSFDGAIVDADFSTHYSRTLDEFIVGYSVNKSGFISYESVIDAKKLSTLLPQELDTTKTGYSTTGKYHDDMRQNIFQTPRYTPRDTFPLTPIEILANSKKCAPSDVDVSCGDYIKFYNNTALPVDFDGVRLRVGYKGQSSTVSNSIPLSGVVKPGEYAVFNTTANNAPLGVTSTGGFVWLEDLYGIVSYDATEVEYPDASSTSHSGQSWAYDDVTDMWGWATPQPFGANQLIQFQEGSNPVSSLTPCRDDQYRSPETNRCRLIEVTAESSLSPCQPGQYRSPETNRCRSVATAAASSPKPCDDNQFRNPDTGRCKLIASLASAELKPCQDGWERNSETNRCRKIAQSSSDVQGYAVENLPTTKDTYLSWWIASGIGLLVLGRIVWEWRVEIANLFRKLGHLRS